MSKTHFGFETVSPAEKTERVSQVFERVAHRYDLMNDLMSFGLHRFWKKITVLLSGVDKGDKVLDLAAGTGDLSLALARMTGPTGHVTMLDLQPAMLALGREKLLNHGITHFTAIEGNAEQLPFPDASFDAVTIGFGLRNVTHPESALREMVRVLKPGKQALILEFSQPKTDFLKKCYDAYSFHVLPQLGEWVVRDRHSYQYLVESIRMHPNQETLKTLMTTAGFQHVTYHNLLGGVVALHRGYKACGKI